jgi:hypothetical protein
MIKTQVLKENNHPIAVVLDYKEYRRLKDLEEDKADYFSALRTRRTNKKLISHEDLKRKLGI